MFYVNKYVVLMKKTQIARGKSKVPLDHNDI